MIPKFRGKCPDAGWIFGSPVKFDEHICFIMPEFNGASTMSYSVIFDRTAQFVDIETVGISTGLKDKNSVEIYEGDIVSVENHPFQKTKNSAAGIEIEGEYPVAWNDYDLTWCAGNLLLSKLKPYIAVKGNIYENPELMEESK